MIPESMRYDWQVALLFLREMHGWSQKELAKKAGLQPSQISLAESGKRRPTGKTLTLILEAMGVSAEKFSALLDLIHRLRTGEDRMADPAVLDEALREIALSLELATDQILERTRKERNDLDPAAIAERLRAESQRLAETDPERAAELLSLAGRMEAGFGEEMVN